MAENERTEETTTPAADTDEVEAHGAKQVVGIGLAAAALVGGGAAAVKLTDGGQPSQRIEGALTSREDAEGSALDLKAADRDGDGYLTYRELAEASGKWSVEALNAEGFDVTAEGLSAAGYKHRLESVGEGGFALEGDTIFLKVKVDDELDAMIEGAALEWSYKLREIDRDGDGYASLEELAEVGHKVETSELREAGYDVSPEDLEKAGVKLPLATFGEGGFVTKDEMVMVKYGVDGDLDAVADKHSP